MLRNALAAVGLYVVGKKALGWYMEYRVLKEAYRQKESQGGSSDQQSHRGPGL